MTQDVPSTFLDKKTGKIQFESWWERLLTKHLATATQTTLMLGGTGALVFGLQPIDLAIFFPSIFSGISCGMVLDCMQGIMNGNNRLPEYQDSRFELDDDFFERETQLQEDFNILAKKVKLNKPVSLSIILGTGEMNAAAGEERDGRSFSVLVTAEMVKHLDQDELQAVVAHELAHIGAKHSKQRKNKLSYLAAAALVSSAVTLVGLSVVSGAAISIVPAAVGLGAILSGFAIKKTGVLDAMLSRHNEHIADRGAALLTGKPKILAKALKKVQSAEFAQYDGQEDMRLSGFSKRTHPWAYMRVAFLERLHDVIHSKEKVGEDFNQSSSRTPKIPKNAYYTRALTRKMTP